MHHYLVLLSFLVGVSACGADQTSVRWTPPPDESRDPDPTRESESTPIPETGPSAPAAQVGKPEQATMQFETPNGEMPSEIPAGGTLTGVIKIPHAAPGEGSNGDSPNAATTLQYSDNESDISAGGGIGHCYVDAQNVVVNAPVPMLVEKGPISHIVHIIWNLECKPGMDRECAGAGIRPFAKNGEVTMDLFRMDDLRVAERSKGKVVLEWGSNKATVDANAKAIYFANLTLKGGYTASGAANCLPERPPAAKP